MDSKIKAALIYGSTRPGRFCDTVAGWAATQIANSGKFLLDVIDPPEKITPTPLKERVEEAEAFVVVTPEYNHGYPAALKSLIDSVGAEWQAKPVAFVSYGGISGGLRAVEQLRQVFAELHTVTVRDSVSFAGAWEHFDGTGVLKEPHRFEKSMTAMLVRLHWWAMALRNARAAVPYVA